MIGKGDPHSFGLARVGEKTQKTAHCLANRVVTRKIPVWTGPSKSRNRTVNDPGIAFLNLLVSEATLLHRPRPEIFDKHVRLVQKLQQNISTAVFADVQS